MHSQQPESLQVGSADHHGGAHAVHRELPLLLQQLMVFTCFINSQFLRAPCHRCLWRLSLLRAACCLAMTLVCNPARNPLPLVYLPQSRVHNKSTRQNQAAQSCSCLPSSHTTCTILKQVSWH